MIVLEPNNGSLLGASSQTRKQARTHTHTHFLAPDWTVVAGSQKFTPCDEGIGVDDAELAVAGRDHQQWFA